ncbi:MAG: hypothetical protein JWQ07_5520 [Ramlibacter sp.]|nr:hypothetical protein [Ramlibacter sp.]
MSRYRFALGPKWIVSHLFVLAMIVTMALLCNWQVNRLHEKRERNDQITARAAEPVAEISSIIGVGERDGSDAVRFRRARAAGHYLTDEEVIAGSPSLDGAPGSWVLTPLRTDDGATVVVNRGWIPNGGGLEAVPEAYRAPSGPVSIVGLVQPSQTEGNFGPSDPGVKDEPSLGRLARIDVGRLDDQVPGDLLPVYLELQSQDPAVAAGDPSLPVAPALDEGPHLSYAFQWAAFIVGTLVFYPLILRRRAREIEREALMAELDEPDPADEPAPGDPRLDPVTGT